jgi:uncharacterized protein YqcC (DUF446 family)
MDQRLPAVAEQLLLIERELRVLGWWSEVPPSPQALASREPFCIDTLDFEAWLQWVFLPKMKGILEAGQELPASSGIRPMAEEAYKSRGTQVVALLDALELFDRLIIGTD